MFHPWGGCLAYNSTNLPNLLIFFPNFLHNTSNVVWTTTSFNCGLPLMCVHTFHWPCKHLFLMLHPSQRAHMDPWCSLQHFCHHCTRCWLSCGSITTTCTSFNHFNSSRWWVDIEFTKYGIHTLVDIVITDPMCVDLLFQSCTTQGFVTFDETQAKKINYYD